MNAPFLSDLEFRRRTTVAGAIWLTLLLGIGAIQSPGFIVPAMVMGAAVLGGVIFLIRIMEIVTKTRAAGSPIPIASIGFLWFFKLVCLGIFVITLKSHSQMPLVLVLIAIGAIFAPLFGLIKLGSRSRENFRG